VDAFLLMNCDIIDEFKRKSLNTNVKK
jgi:hypothetical protein